MSSDPAERARERREQIQDHLRLADEAESFVDGAEEADVKLLFRVHALSERVQAICLHLGLTREEDDGSD